MTSETMMTFFDELLSSMNNEKMEINSVEIVACSFLISALCLKTVSTIFKCELNNLKMTIMAGAFPLSQKSI